MANYSDLTFITNEKGQTLLERFKVLIKDAEFFDVLVGYFYTSGFHVLYKSLERTKKIRILIGITINRPTLDLIKQKEKEGFSVSAPSIAVEREFSHAETKEHFSNLLTAEMERAEDSRKVEEGVTKFLDWLQSGKLEIKVYPTKNIHAKLYIISFAESDRDVGRVITGSSNFTQAGLIDNLEFNIELKNVADYKFALNKFNQLWDKAIDVSETYIETVKNKTWLNDAITPYELYLKFLYEYFKDQISQNEDIFYKYTPARFKRLKYQEQAVLNAKKILLEYGGVFISDVVGLGKTYIAAMLANQLDGRHLVVAPPVLLEKNNPGSWPNVFTDFGVRGCEFESIGKLDKLIKRGTDKYDNIFIDEAHRFRTEDAISYELLSRICRGKKVILVTATPYNNSPKDILSQIKLFQKPRKSTIPGLPNLELFFSNLEKRLKGLDRKRDKEQYMEVVRSNAKEIRERVLKYLMVRRTRNEIKRYFKDDLIKQKLKFPDVADPEPILYQLSKQEDRIFIETIKLITQKFKYARYTPLLYYKGEVSQAEHLGQKNMGKFMKILLVKRLESSFYAFRNTIDRFISSYERFLTEFKKGNVYVSKKYSAKIFDLLGRDDTEAILRLIEEGKAKRYPAKDFEKEFRQHLESDLSILKNIASLWRQVIRDPKLERFIHLLSTRKVFQNNKIIIFTESKETAEYLAKDLSKKFGNKVLLFHGSSSTIAREKVIENFDAQARFPKDDYRILITTEVLSEGVNLHRANVVVNYDIPWNPTRLMQRVGRINRVDTSFDKIYTFNFFPTEQSNDEIKLKEAAEAKIHAFIELLGNDARLLTEGEEIKSHDLWLKLTSKKTITGEDEEEESELEYLSIIRDIRDKNPDLFEKIKRLPKKARTARIYKNKSSGNMLLTYFRKGKIQKFYLVSPNTDPKELDFITAAKILQADKKTVRRKVPKDYYTFLTKNKQAFELASTEEAQDIQKRRGRDAASQLLYILKSREVKKFKGFTEDEEVYLEEVARILQEGSLPKSVAKRVLKRIHQELASEFNPLKLLGILRRDIPNEFFKETLAETAAQTAGPREVILSEYLIVK